MIQSQVCQSNPFHLYQILIPENLPPGKKIPLLVVIDPLGDSENVIKIFSHTVLALGMAIAGSQLIKNGNLHYLRELNELIGDVTSRFPVGDTVFLAGFSGGARMALSYAGFRRVAGVLACGALAPAEALRRAKSGIMCIMGVEDYNFPELAAFILNPENCPDNLSMEITKDPHRWPSAEMLHSVMELLVQASDQQMEPQRFPEIPGFISKQKLRLESHLSENDLIRAVLIAGKMAKLPVFDKDGYFRNLHRQLIQEEDYLKQTALLSYSLLFEEQKRLKYIHALFYESVAWWGQELESWNELNRTEEDNFMLMAHRRLKSWLMEACQSVCSRYEKEKEAQKLERIQRISRLIK
jgi:hypothetical protein